VELDGRIKGMKTAKVLKKWFVVRGSPVFLSIDSTLIQQKRFEKSRRLGGFFHSRTANH